MLLFALSLRPLVSLQRNYILIYFARLYHDEGINVGPLQKIDGIGQAFCLLL